MTTATGPQQQMPRLAAAAIIFAAVALLRGPTFWMTAIFFDEGVFSLMSQSIADGYVACEHPVLYQTLQMEPATRFVFYPHHLGLKHSGPLGFTPEEAVAEIVARRPATVLLGPFAACIWVTRDTWRGVTDAFTEAGYRLVATVEGIRVLQPGGTE